MTTNRVGNVTNANTGRNHGYINQDDNQGVFPQASWRYPLPANVSPPGGGSGSHTHLNMGIPRETRNYIDTAKNFNAGDNYGTINQNDNRPASIPVTTVRVPPSHPAVPALATPAPPPKGTSSSKGSTDPLKTIAPKKKR